MSRSKQTSPGAALFQQESDKSLGANTLDDHQRIRQRPRRVRAHTLVAGSPFHTAFFGNDETLRDGFDCEQVASSFCNPKSPKLRSINNVFGVYRYHIFFIIAVICEQELGV